MAGGIAFDDSVGRVFPTPVGKRPSLQVLHSLPAGLRRQVHLADQQDAFRTSDALTIAAGLPGLQWQRVHEVVGRGALHFGLSAAKQAKAASSAHPVVIIGTDRDVHALRPEGLGAYIPPASVTLIEAGRRNDILWAAEQALAAKAQAIVLVQIDQGPTLSESRSLQIAAEQGGSLGIILISRQARSSACQTRWDCAPVPKGWDWTVVKNKTGPVGQWRIRAGPDGQMLDPVPLSRLVTKTAAPPHEPTTHSSSVVSLPPLGSSPAGARPSP
ncbi:MAG: hypothetical protein ACSHX3_01755 [Litorimonas sp.]